ncbi:MAG: transglutaminase family protein [Flavobacteriales bacterium]|nr:transglutaminase family protein [Flavobacteriales bacterium]
MENSEIRALISLLDDPDKKIYTQIENKLISMGEDVIPYLETAWEYDSWGIAFQDRIENIIHTIQFEQVKERLNNWAIHSENDLLKGMILIAQYQYPDLDENRIHEQIEKIEKDVWLELNNTLTALEKVRIINHIMFEVHGFSSNVKSFHSPQNSFINEVLDSKKGNPISLAILYSIIAQKHDMPLIGVNLPKHFILGYRDDFMIDLRPDDDVKVLFYVNPFSRGAVFSKREVDDFLKQLDIEPKPSYYLPCTNIEIMVRVLNNLIYSYEKLGYSDKVNELKELKGLLKKE